MPRNGQNWHFWDFTGLRVYVFYGENGQICLESHSRIYPGIQHFWVDFGPKRPQISRLLVGPSVRRLKRLGVGVGFGSKWPKIQAFWGIFGQKAERSQVLGSGGRPFKALTGRKW